MVTVSLRKPMQFASPFVERSTVMLLVLLARWALQRIWADQSLRGKPHVRLSLVAKSTKSKPVNLGRVPRNFASPRIDASPGGGLNAGGGGSGGSVP